MLGRVEEVPLSPKGLNSAHDDAGPYLAGGFDKGDGTDVVEVRGVKDLR